MVDVIFKHKTGAALGYSIERGSDGAYFDFVAGTFTRVVVIETLCEDLPDLPGRYRANLLAPPAEFVDGEYWLTVYDRAAWNLIVAKWSIMIHQGAPAPVTTEPPLPASRPLLVQCGFCADHVPADQAGRDQWYRIVAQSLYPGALDDALRFLGRVVAPTDVDRYICDRCQSRLGAQPDPLARLYLVGVERAAAAPGY